MASRHFRSFSFESQTALDCLQFLKRSKLDRYQRRNGTIWPWARAALWSGRKMTTAIATLQFRAATRAGSGFDRSSCNLRPKGPYARRRTSNQEQESQDRGGNPQPDQNLRALTPDQQQLDDQRGPCDMAHSLDEPIGGCQ